MAIARALPAVFFAVLAASGQTSTPWRFWDVKDGFVESYTSSMAPSADGRVWAKHGVLGRIELLDGYSTPRYPEPLTSGQLETAPDGTVWIWSGKGLSRLDEHKWTAFNLDEVVRSGSIRNTPQEAWHFISYKSAFLSGSISVVALDRSHALIMLPDRILEFEAGHSTTRTVLSLAETGLRRLTALKRSREGSVYLTGYGGLGRLEGAVGRQWHWQPLPSPAGYTEFDEPVSVRPHELFVAGITPALTASALRFDGREWESLYKGQSSRLKAWPGTESSFWVQDGNHIFEVVGGRVTVAERAGGLSGVLLSSMVEGPGRFWIAGSQGLSHYMPSLWRTPEGAPATDDLINSIAEDRTGNLWFLAESGLIRFDNRKWTSYPLPKDESQWAILTEGLIPLPDGRIIVQTMSPHLLIFDPVRENFQSWTHPGGRATRMVTAQPGGTVLVEVYTPGSKETEIESFDGQEFRPYLSREKLKGISDLRALVSGGAGKVWLGTTVSFSVSDAAGVRPIGMSHGFTDPGAYFIFPDRSGHLFAGGSDGFFAQTDGKWKLLQAGLDRVRNAITARDGSMWIASGSGVHHYRNGEWISQGTEEGLPSSVAYKVFEDSRGRIWAGTTRGLSLLHPEADTDPPVVSFAGSHVPTEAPPGGQFHLEFAAVDKWKFSPASRLLYSYRLDGGAWSSFSPVSSASFDSLLSGKHRLEVRAMDRNANISVSPAVHAFSVLPVWYRTPQFLVLALGAGAIIVVLFVLASTSYAHRGALIRSLNQKSKLERDRQNVLEKIARREPLADILRQIADSLAESCPRAVSLLVWTGDGGLEVFSCPPLTDQRRLNIVQSRVPDDPGLQWWRLLCGCAGEYSDNSPMVEIHSGDRETRGVMTLLFPEREPIPQASHWLLETFHGLAAAAIENARLYERLAHQARHDVLTGLPNRLSFDDKLRSCVQSAYDTGQPLAVFYLDLDGFKQINDRLGHRVGDHFLREVSRRFSAALHEGATLARIGGDEFTVLLEYGADKPSARLLAGRIHDALRAPIVIEGEELSPGVSIGISLFPEDGTTPSTLQKNADIAMYRAKAKGRNCLEFFSAANPPVAATLDRAQRQALDESSLELFYQPHFTPDGMPGGMEALLQLRRAGGGYYSYGEFVSTAEDTGLILPMGRWALREACRQLRQWLDEGVPATRITVNVSAAEIASDSYARDVALVLAEMRVPPELLELELAESAVVRNPAESSTQLRRLRDTGVRLALDDFGRGHTSFAQLQALPLCTLKIDRSLIKGLSGSDRSPQTDSIAAIVSLGRNLGLSVVADGIETEEQLSIARESGCDLVQGSLFSGPVPAREARRFLSRENYFTQAATPVRS